MTESFREAIAGMDATLIEAKEAARCQVASELQELVREQAPGIFRRMRRTFDKPVRNPCDALRCVIVGAMTTDESGIRRPPRIVLVALANLHLRQSLRKHMKHEFDLSRGVLFSSEMVDSLEETATLLIKIYPEQMKPTMPRRIDLGRMVHRYLNS
jgi:hypothetical protein